MKQNSSNAIKILLDQVQFESTDHVLLFFPDSMDSVKSIGQQVSYLAIAEIDFARLSTMRMMMQNLENVSFYDPLLKPETNAFDKVLLFAPKGRVFARFLLRNAAMALRIQGRLYVVGSNDEGVKSVISDADIILGNTRIVAYKKGYRIGVSTKTELEANIPNEWGISADTWKNIRVETGFGDLNLMSVPGIFSWDELDVGTEILLQQPYLRKVAEGSKILDVGCGNGVIGCSLARTAAYVDLVDTNLIAVQAAQHTIEANHLTNAKAFPSDVYSSVTDNYDLIVSNPPFHQGFGVSTSVAHRIIAQAPQFLKSKGEIMVVCNTFLPHEEIMNSTFKSVNLLYKGTKFKVLVAKGHLGKQ